jgi:hypothetical protein
MKTIEELEELAELIKILPCWGVGVEFVGAKDVKEHPLCENLPIHELAYIAAIIRDSCVKHKYRQVVILSREESNNESP